MLGMLTLATTRRFLPLFATQLLGAVNDNLFKNALVVAVYRVSGGPLVVVLAGGLFILPYLLFSARAGGLADTHEKARLIRITKFGELGLMLLGALGFLTHSLALMLGVLFGLGVQATFFGPLKYAILPDHLRPEELLAGNGLIEAGTFLGILLGTLAGGLLVSGPSGAQAVALAGPALAVAGIAAAWFVPAAPPGRDPRRAAGPGFTPTAALLRKVRADRGLFHCLLGISWFWAVGATLLAEFPTIAARNLQADAPVVTLMLTMFSLGVGAGSLLCARLTHGRVSTRLVPWAALGISLFTADFAWTAAASGALPDVRAVLQSWRGLRMLADLALLAGCGGIYSVPLYALIQLRAPGFARARVISANNILNALAMVAASALTAVIFALSRSAPVVLLATAAGNLGVTAWLFRKRPEPAAPGAAAMTPVAIPGEREG